MANTDVCKRLTDDFDSGKFNFREASPFAVGIKYGVSNDEAAGAIAYLAKQIGGYMSAQMGKAFGNGFFIEADKKMKSAPAGRKESVKRDIYAQCGLLLEDGDAAVLAEHSGLICDKEFVSSMLFGEAKAYEERFGERLAHSLRLFVKGLAQPCVLIDMARYISSRAPRKIIVENKRPNEGLIGHDGNEEELDDISLEEKFDSFMDSLEMREREDGYREPFQYLF